MSSNKFCRFTYFFAVFIIGTVVGVGIYQNLVLRILNNPHPELYGIPDSTGVRIDSTNLPIVFINTNNEYFTCDYITANMVIVNSGGINYGDTIGYPNQKTDYSGLVGIKFRGNSSYSFSAKKSFTITALDAPLKNGGVKKKSSLLGMRKGKKWALKASHFDKSMMKDVLTFELARSYMDFVPQARYCEVIVNGIYFGVYILMETVSASRLKIGKPDTKKNDHTGGYLLQLDRRRDTIGAYFSHYYPKLVYKFESPKNSELSSLQMNYIHEKIDSLEYAFVYGDYNDISRQVDLCSMIDYQLSTEFAQNGDGYDMSNFLYKKNNAYDSLFRFVLWDFDQAYNTPSQTRRIRLLVYPNKQKEANTDFWWSRMMKEPLYYNSLCNRWKKYRQEAYTNEHIHHLIDSLANVLTMYQAISRNGKAWPKLWGTDWRGPERRLEYVISRDYEEEIEILKEWIDRRLEWLDKDLDVDVVHK